MSIDKIELLVVNEALEKENAQLRITIDELQAEIQELEDDADFLAALQAAGVDNWEGYEHAQEIMNQ